MRRKGKTKLNGISHEGRHRDNTSQSVQWVLLLPYNYLINLRCTFIYILLKCCRISLMMINVENKRLDSFGKK